MIRFPAIRGRLLKLAARGGLFEAGDAVRRHVDEGDAMPFIRFVREYFEFPGDPVFLPNLWHVHLPPRFFRLEPRAAELAGLYLDYEFIDALRGGAAVRGRKAIDGQVDRQSLELVVDHVYLALLRRYPSRTARTQGVTELVHGRGIEKLIDVIRMSGEYVALQRGERLP